MEVYELDSGAVLRPGDELDLLGYQGLGEQVDKLLHEAVKCIVIDLTHATYVNAPAVRTLVALRERAAAAGASIALACASGGAVACLEAGGALAGATVYGSVEEAMSSLSAGDRRR